MLMLPTIWPTTPDTHRFAFGARCDVIDTVVPEVRLSNAVTNGSHSSGSGVGGDDQVVRAQLEGTHEQVADTEAVLRRRRSAAQVPGVRAGPGDGRQVTDQRVRGLQMLGTQRLGLVEMLVCLLELPAVERQGAEPGQHLDALRIGRPERLTMGKAGAVQ